MPPTPGWRRIGGAAAEQRKERKRSRPPRSPKGRALLAPLGRDVGAHITIARCHPDRRSSRPMVAEIYGPNAQSPGAVADADHCSDPSKGLADVDNFT